MVTAIVRRRSLGMISAEHGRLPETSSALRVTADDLAGLDIAVQQAARDLGAPVDLAVALGTLAVMNGYAAKRSDTHEYSASRLD